MGKCFSTCMGLSQSSRQQNGHQNVGQTSQLCKLTTALPPQSTVHNAESPSPSIHTPRDVIPELMKDSDTFTEGFITTSEKRPSATSSQGSRAAPASHRNSSGSEQVKKHSSVSKEMSDVKINALFEVYRDPDEDNILADGIEKFCSDLKVRPDEFKILVLAWKFNAQTMCKFTRAEFVNGCKAIKADSIRSIQSKFPELLREVKDPSNFREMYRWTFKFGVDEDVGKKTLLRDMAVSLWRLVFTQCEPPILQRWLDFLERHDSIKGVSKDTWDMFLNFTEVIGEDLSTYDDTEAWPSLLDDFVEYENDRQNQNVSDVKTD